MPANTSWSGKHLSFTPSDRARILRRDPVCKCSGWCGQHNGPCTNPSTIADHTLAQAAGGAHDWRTNSQGLCSPCHDIKTETEKTAGRIRNGKRRPPDTAKHPGLA